MSEKPTPCVDITIDWSELEPLTPAARAGVPKQKWHALQSRHDKSEFSYQDATWQELYSRWQGALTKLTGEELQNSLSGEQKNSVATLTAAFSQTPQQPQHHERVVRAAMTANLFPTVTEEGSAADWMDCELHHLRDETRFKANGWRGPLPQNIIEMTKRVATWDGTGSPLVVSVPNPAVERPEVESQLLSGKGLSAAGVCRTASLSHDVHYCYVP